MDQEHEFQLPRQTLAERMATALRQQILTGRLQPGQPLPTERDLGEAFGVGRTTVREALHGLIAGGFLDRRNKQLYVRDRVRIPEHDLDYAALAARLSVEDVFETRKALESKAVEQAARNWADDDLIRLRDVLDRMRNRSGADYHAADVEFHTTVVEISKNAVLRQVYESSKGMFFKLPSFWRLFSSVPGAAPTRPITGWEGHRKVVDAIEARDPVLAVRLNDELLDRVMHTLVERMNQARTTGVAAATDHLTSKGTD